MINVPPVAGDPDAAPPAATPGVALEPGSPFDDHYGLRIRRGPDGSALGTLQVEPHHLQPTGRVHGGVYASIAEALASFGTNWRVGPDRVGLGLQNTTNFLRGCGTGRLHGHAVPVHAGRETWVWDVTIRDDDGALCAGSRVTVAVRRRPSAA